MENVIGLLREVEVHKVVAAAHSIAKRNSMPSYADALAIYLLRMDGWVSFDRISIEFDGATRVDLLKRFNRLAVDLFSRDRRVERLVEIAREELRGQQWA